jgi:hypothetical protein
MEATRLQVIVLLLYENQEIIKEKEKNLVLGWVGLGWGVFLTRTRAGVFSKLAARNRGKDQPAQRHMSLSSSLSILRLAKSI